MGILNSTWVGRGRFTVWEFEINFAELKRNWLKAQPGLENGLDLF